MQPASLWNWSPSFHLPLSGDVAQRIAPETRWFFGAIERPAGHARIEQRAFEVASYGRQLGALTELLLALADQAGGEPALQGRAAEALADLREIHKKIAEIKQEEYARDVDAMLGALDQLRCTDPPRYAEAQKRLRRSLDAWTAAGDGGAGKT